MKNIYYALLGTPWWVYLLFAFLFYTGLKARKSSTIPIKKLFMFPAIFIIWSLLSLISKVANSNIYLILIWITLGFIGYLIGLKITQTTNVQVDRINSVITIPGSGWIMLLALMSIFFIKYLFGYTYSTNPSAIAYCLPLDLGFSGAITGIFLGRAHGYFKKY
ncbi:MAG: hypothetical protein HQK49_19735 [Oligoflexia bacterium]|nr:hypothetical protein [Oligoflexia bacterium]